MNNVRKLSYAAFAVIAFRAEGACWNDARLSDMASTVARQSFPSVADTPVVVCSADTFAPNVGGIYEASHLIRIPVWQLSNPSMLTQVIAHELAHAEVNRRGGDMHTYGGHSADFMSVLIAAGYGAEAQRTAYATPGAVLAFAMAQQATQLRSSPAYDPLPTDTGSCGPIPCRPRIRPGMQPQIAQPPTPHNQCQAIPVHVHTRGPDGRWHRGIQYQRWCG